jgi:hypothetical protein
LLGRFGQLLLEDLREFSLTLDYALVKDLAAA